MEKKKKRKEKSDWFRAPGRFAFEARFHRWSNPVRKIRTVRGKTGRCGLRDIVYYIGSSRERGIRSVGWKRIMEARRDRSTIMHNVTRRVVNITVNGNGSVILRAETHGRASLPVNVPIFFRSIFRQRKSREPRSRPSCPTSLTTPPSQRFVSLSNRSTIVSFFFT